MDISDVLVLIDEIAGFEGEEEMHDADFSVLRADEIRRSDIDININSVPRIIP